ncbi:hypothetical protein AB4Z01_26565 [Inquilinus sp. YAF38]|uniref:hypothetical protein n=1 Tax=Inquilinus sp. YAF38 TaxID=3233084 RepID=UPI003F92C655
MQPDATVTGGDRDAVSVLYSGYSHQVQAKRIRPDGNGGIAIVPYGHAAWFSVRQVPVDSIDGIYQLLVHIQGDPRKSILRDEPMPGINRDCTRRLSRDRQGEKDPLVHPLTKRPDEGSKPSGRCRACRQILPTRRPRRPMR